MRSKYNQVPSRGLPPKALAFVSAITMAASGLVAPEANANNYQPQRPTVGAEMDAKNAPLNALTGFIAGLEKGKSVEVTAKPIELDGAVTDVVEGHPIVFKVGDQTYFAFRQGSKPNFDTTPQETASTMRIIDAQFPSDDATIPVTEAYLNEKRVLVEARNHTAVGYAVAESQ